MCAKTVRRSTLYGFSGEIVDLFSITFPQHFQLDFVLLLLSHLISLIFELNFMHRSIDLIESLVIHLDNEDPQEGVFLVFAPTYRHLEQIYQVLMDQNRNYTAEELARVAIRPFPSRLFISNISLGVSLKAKESRRVGRACVVV